MKKDTYSVTVDCHNCWSEIKVKIPKGILVDKYRTKCPKCDCLVIVLNSSKLEEKK